MELVLRNKNDIQVQHVINSIPNTLLYNSIYIQNCNFVIGINFFKQLEHVKAIAIRNVSSKMLPILGILLQDFNQIESISIDYCLCHFWDVLTFLEIMKKSNIVSLQLNNVFPNLRKNEIEILFQIFYELEKIRVLDWSGNYMDNNILSLFSQFKFLESLTITTDFISLLEPANVVLTNLKHVHIVNIMSNMNECSLLYFLESIPQSIIIIDVKSLFRFSFENYLDFFSTKKQLRSLSLSGIGIDDRIFSKFCQTIHSFEQMERLELSYNEITEASYPHLLSLFDKLPKIEEVDISENKIQDHGLFFDYLFTQKHHLTKVILYSSVKHQTIPKYNNYKENVKKLEKIWKEIKHFTRWSEMKHIHNFIKHFDFLHVDVDVFDKILIEIEKDYNRFLFLITKYIHEHEYYCKFNDWIEINCKKNLVLHEQDIQREIIQYI